ncbi:MAG: hypothetical protein U0228_37835 [Myxococcaceae bacterium]
MSTAPKSFDADEMLLEVEHRDRSLLRLEPEPESYVRRFTAWVVRSADPEEELPFPAPEDCRIAKVDFEQIATNAWGDGDTLKSIFADAISGDLLALFEAIYDDQGDVREELNSSMDGDLLHIEMIEVEPGENVFEVVRYALENILVRYGNGAMGAAYYQANWESIGVARPLKDRGFIQAKANRHVWFADLGLRREPLP